MEIKRKIYYELFFFIINNVSQKSVYWWKLEV